jgi:hypothetical protein
MIPNDIFDPVCSFRSGDPQLGVNRNEVLAHSFVSRCAQNLVSGFGEIALGSAARRADVLRHLGNLTWSQPHVTIFIDRHKLANRDPATWTQRCWRPRRSRRAPLYGRRTRR